MYDCMNFGPLMFSEKPSEMDDVGVLNIEFFLNLNVTFSQILLDYFLLSWLSGELNSWGFTFEQYSTNHCLHINYVCKITVRPNSPASLKYGSVSTLSTTHL